MTTRTEDALRLAQAMHWTWMYRVPHHSMSGSVDAWSGFRTDKGRLIEFPEPIEDPIDVTAHLRCVGELAEAAGLTFLEVRHDCVWNKPEGWVVAFKDIQKALHWDAATDIAWAAVKAAVRAALAAKVGEM